MNPISLLITHDSHVVDANNPIGRHVANSSFLKAYLGHQNYEKYYIACTTPEVGEKFHKLACSINPIVKTISSPLAHWGDIARMTGCFHFPDPALNQWSWSRMPWGDGEFSLIGIVHTLSTKPIQEALGQYLISPIRRWDALICTSSAARISVIKFLERQERWLYECNSSIRFEYPQLPIIPLGIEPQDWVPARSKIIEQKAARDILGLSQESVYILIAGRLDFLTKFKPEPLLRCLSELKQKRFHNLALLVYGESPNSDMERRWHEGALQIAPDLPIKWVEGKKSQLAAQIRWASDIFVSLSDNTQETFGITPLEAMASELPCIVSDWDGYKDTVVTPRESIHPTGFRVPTLMVQHLGKDEAKFVLSRAMTDDIAMGRISQGISVDVEYLKSCLIELLESSALRKEMGVNGRCRVEQHFAWNGIINQWSDLVARLNSIRAYGVKKGLNRSPQLPHWFPDYCTSFGNYASKVIPDSWRPELPSQEKQYDYISNPFNDWDIKLLEEQGSARHRGWCLKQGLISLSDLRSNI